MKYNDNSIYRVKLKSPVDNYNTNEIVFVEYSSRIHIFMILNTNNFVDVENALVLHEFAFEK